GGLRRPMKLQTGIGQIMRIDRAQGFPVTHYKDLPRLGCRRAGDVSVDRAYRRGEPERSLYGAGGAGGLPPRKRFRHVASSHRRDATWGTPWGVSEAGKTVRLTMSFLRGNL